MRKSRRCVLLLVGACLVGCSPTNREVTSQELRTVTLGDGRCEAVVMLRPQDTTDLLKEFGPRFDQTALVRQVTVGGKTFLFEPWGLIDEFGIGGDGVLGYEQAGMGGSFLKVGVGILERNQKKPYSFWGRFPLISSAPTRVMHRDRDSLALEQSASLGEWGYRYTKRYRVEPRTATLRIEYELTNTGKSPYPVEQYNHNWLCFDHIPIGSGYTVQTAFGVDKPTKPANWLERVDGEFRLRPISKPCYLPSEQSAPVEENRMVVQYDGRQALTMTGDFPVHRFGMWTDGRAISPEVFFWRENLKPGESVRWSRTYHFKAN